MVRLLEVFECLRDAGFTMRVAKCDFMESEIKFLGRIVSAKGLKPDPKAVGKLRDWEIPRNKIEMQIFLGFANHYREFIPWHAKLVAPLHANTGTNATFMWGSEQHLAYNISKRHSSTRLPLNSLTLKANSCWTLMPALLLTLAYSISGKAHQEKGAYGQSFMVAKN